MRKSIVKFCKLKLLSRGVLLKRIGILEKELTKCFLTKRSFSFLQIGANDGVNFDDLYWHVRRFRGFGVVVEPLENEFDRLLNNYKSLPAVKALRCAIHNEADEIAIYSVNRVEGDGLPSWVDGMASLDRNWLVKEKIPHNQISTQHVPAQHMMQVIEKYELWDLDLLQVDAEGFDLEVIAMIDFERVRPRVIKYERPLALRGTNDTAADEIAQYLIAQGYSVTPEGYDAIAICRK